MKVYRKTTWLYDNMTVQQNYLVESCLNDKIRISKLRSCTSLTAAKGLWGGLEYLRVKNVGVDAHLKA